MMLVAMSRWRTAGGRAETGASQKAATFPRLKNTLDDFRGIRWSRQELEAADSARAGSELGRGSADANAGMENLPRGLHSNNSRKEDAMSLMSPQELVASRFHDSGSGGAAVEALDGRGRHLVVEPVQGREEIHAVPADSDWTGAQVE
jgi:hypothetical protein